MLNIQSGPSDVITTADTILDSAPSRSSLMTPADGPDEETGVLGYEHGSFWDIL